MVKFEENGIQSLGVFSESTTLPLKENADHECNTLQLRLASNRRMGNKQLIEFFIFQRTSKTFCAFLYKLLLLTLTKFIISITSSAAGWFI